MNFVDVGQFVANVADVGDDHYAVAPPQSSN